MDFKEKSFYTEEYKKKVIECIILLRKIVETMHGMRLYDAEKMAIHTIEQIEYWYAPERKLREDLHMEYK